MTDTITKESRPEDHTAHLVAPQQEALFSTLQMLTKEQITKKLTNNTDRLFLSDLRKKEVYLTKNTCVDGREDENGISTFGGAAGTLGAHYLALVDFFQGEKTEQEIIQLLEKFVGDIPLYLHDDEHAVHENHHGHPCDCKHIGCGAIDRMLGEKKLDETGKNARGFGIEGRALFWHFLKKHAKIKVLTGEHKEQSILWIKNTPRVDHETGEKYIDLIQKNKRSTEDGEEIQDFSYHETGRNMIIDYICEDMANLLCDTVDHSVLRDLIYRDGNKNRTLGSEQNIVSTLHYLLKEKTDQIADCHVDLTANDLPPAKKCLDNGNVVYVKKISHKGDHRIEVNP